MSAATPTGDVEAVLDRAIDALCDCGDFDGHPGDCAATWLINAAAALRAAPQPSGGALTDEEREARMSKLSDAAVAAAEEVWTEDEPTLAEYELAEAILRAAQRDPQPSEAKWERHTNREIERALREAQSPEDSMATDEDLLRYAGRDEAVEIFRTMYYDDEDTLAADPSAPVQTAAEALRLAAHLASESVGGGRCEITASGGYSKAPEAEAWREDRGRCAGEVVAVRWEDGFADEVCDKHADEGRSRGALVVYPQRHDGTAALAQDREAGS